GRGLAVLGLAAVIPAVLSANGWALVAALGGFVAATGLALGPLVRAWLADEPLTRASDFEHTLDLLRRAPGARAGWAAGVDDRAVVGALGGVAGATGGALGPLVRAWLADEPLTRASDFEHTLDLLRRAHGARAGWAVGFDDREVEVLGREEVDGTVRQRGAALVQLASVDGRAHTARDPGGNYVAVGDFPFGAGLLLTQSDA